MKKYLNELSHKINSEITNFYLLEDDIIERSLKTTQQLHTILEDLRKKISSYDFKNKEDEILFFKEKKPTILSKLLYFNKIFQIESKIPNGSDDVIIRYLHKELESLTYFFDKNQDFYQYYRSKSTFYDEDYFIRNKNKIYLNEIADNARTHGLSEPIGSLYGFTLLVKSETTVKDGFDLVQNRFFIKGEGEILYNYNHGHIASDPKTAAANFLNALDTMPTLLEKYKTDNEKLMKDVPTLKAVVENPWKKEDELKGLKVEMVAMERKIEASLKPIEQSVGIMAGVPKDENKFVLMPDNLQIMNKIMDERTVTVRPAYGVPLERKGIKI